MTDDGDRYVTISVSKKKPPGKPDKPGKPPIDPPIDPVEPPPVDPVITGWSRVPLGPGGFISGVEIHRSGTMICRMDTSGGYRWDSAAQRWVMMITTDSMPPDVTSPGYGPNNGIYAIAIAPSDGNRIYIAWQHLTQYLVMRSDDAGLTFQHTGYIAASTYEWNGNGISRAANKRMAVDPNNADRVLLATMTGVKHTTDGGATWNRLADIPDTTKPEMGYLVAFDAAGDSYVMSTGHGVFISDPYMEQWHVIGGPTSSQQMAVTPAGEIFAIIDYGYANELWAPVWIYDGTTWTTVQPDATPHAILGGVTFDPANPSHIVVVDNEGNVSSSFDQGLTWTGFAGHHYSCPEIGWLDTLYGDWAGEWGMYGSGIQFDPAKPNTLLMGFGLGIAWCHPPSDKTKVEWTDISRGLEQLCAKRLIKPEGNPNVILAVMDQGVFSCDGVDYPATKGIMPEFAAAWDCDWCPDDPNTVIALINQAHGGRPDQSGISRDGGQTWTMFENWDFNSGVVRSGGMIACGCDPDNFIIVMADNGQQNGLYYTRDGGRSWALATMPPGVPASGDTGWIQNYYYNRHTICGDRVLDGVFYGRNNNIGHVRSIDYGETWELVHPLVGGTHANARLVSVPGQAGHMLYSSGSSGHTNFGGAMKMSTDGGTTWTDTSTGEVLCMGFGAPAPGQDYPAVYIVGWVNNVYGIWRSDDACMTWVSIGDFPMGCFDTPVDIAGDLDAYGHCYLSVGASGIFKYIPEGEAP